MTSTVHSHSKAQQASWDVSVVSVILSFSEMVPSDHGRIHDDKPHESSSNVPMWSPRVQRKYHAMFMIHLSVGARGRSNQHAPYSVEIPDHTSIAAGNEHAHATCDGKSPRGIYKHALDFGALDQSIVNHKYIVGVPTRASCLPATCSMNRGSESQRILLSSCVEVILINHNLQFKSNEIVIDIIEIFSRPASCMLRTSEKDIGGVASGLAAYVNLVTKAQAQSRVSWVGWHSGLGRRALSFNLKWSSWKLKLRTSPTAIINHHIAIKRGFELLSFIFQGPAAEPTSFKRNRLISSASKMPSLDLEASNAPNKLYWKVKYLATPSSGPQEALLVRKFAGLRAKKFTKSENCGFQTG
ncbi:hypothetical protein BDZ97DRAFT_2055310 [Flammula alnicola]|nr:hypothetical protein BDZ97DRAFT_2055310 [Flammula alnicola]